VSRGEDNSRVQDCTFFDDGDISTLQKKASNDTRTALVLPYIEGTGIDPPGCAIPYSYSSKSCPHGIYPFTQPKMDREFEVRVNHNLGKQLLLGNSPPSRPTPLGEIFFSIFYCNDYRHDLNFV
jgi:hypothetical protein